MWGPRYQVRNKEAIALQRQIVQTQKRVLRSSLSAPQLQRLPPETTTIDGAAAPPQLHSPQAAAVDRRRVVVRRPSATRQLGQGHGIVLPNPIAAKRPVRQLVAKITQPLAGAGAAAQTNSEKPLGDSPEIKQELFRKNACETIGFKAIHLAKRHRLDFHEVKKVVVEIMNTQRSMSGSLTKEQFRSFLCRVFGIDSISEEFLDNVFDEMARHEHVNLNVDDFLAWYKQNMFSRVAQLRSDRATTAFDSLILDLAKTHGVPASEVDKVKMVFDRWDVDKSGVIEFEEFVGMIHALVGAGRGDISKDRLTKFWKEIDSNGNGEVDFTEFAPWYLKYFNSKGLGFGPAEAFYASYSPSAQRASYLNSVVDT